MEPVLIMDNLKQEQIVQLLEGQVKEVKNQKQEQEQRLVDQELKNLQMKEEQKGLAQIVEVEQKLKQRLKQEVEQKLHQAVKLVQGKRATVKQKQILNPVMEVIL